MAAGAWKVIGAALEQVHKATIDLDTNTFRMALVTSGWTPNQSTNNTWNDVTPGTNEVVGTGYTQHGKLLTCTVTRSGLVVTFDCDDQSWTSSTITAKYAVIVKDSDANGALATTDPMLCYSDLNDGGASVSTTNGAFSITISASGVFASTAA